MKDTVRIGGVEMEGVQFGLSTFSTHEHKAPRISTVGVMGLGLEALDASAVFHNSTPYPNIVSELKAHGVIRTRAFSLYLNSIGKTTLILGYCCLVPGPVHELLLTGPCFYRSTDRNRSLWRNGRDQISRISDLRSHNPQP